VSRRPFLAILTLATFHALLLGCTPEKPRSLVVADGSGTIHSAAVDARVKAFQQRTGRPVRILPVPAAQAVLLANRGEADVAVVPMNTSLDTFLAAEHGRVAGLLVSGGERLRILEVDAKQHPKVDAKGAKDLATALITPP
jgi:ABC-type tungstate transport system permease subunit